MEISVRATLDELGIRRVADAAGIPFWTLRKWRDKDGVPGKGSQRDMRMRHLADAINKVRAEEKAKAKKRRAA